MNQRLFLRLIIAAVLISTLRAQTLRRATVAFITNDEGAHLSMYLLALAESKEISSVILADPSGKMVAVARQALGDRLTATYASARELFAHHQPNLAVISLEPKLAAKAIDEALDAGCDVLAEKPACLSVAEFARLAQKANDKKVFLALALANRLNPEIEFARDLIEKNRIGKIYGIELHIIADQTRLSEPSYHQSWFAQKSRAGGGHLIWLGIHWVDLAMFLTHSNITEISGFTANVGGQPIDVEDSAVLSIKFDHGFLGTMTSGYYLDKGYHSHVKIWGSAGWIELNPYGAVVPFRYYSTTDERPEIKTYTRPDVPVGYSPFVAACVRASLGLELPPVTTNDSLRAIKTIFAAYEAAETGQTQQVPGTSE
jgi:predicted dehydrogenase